MQLLRQTFLATALCLPALAGPIDAPADTASNSGDWCDWLKSKPGLIKDKNGKIFQSFQIGGRFQYQAAYLDGDLEGDDFNSTYDEYRRVRLETKLEFLQYFAAKANLNMVGDTRFSGGELDWGYQDFDELVFTFDIKKAFADIPLDKLKINYGRQKFVLTEEVRTSSKEIITIERSAISNKVYNSARPTGITLDGEKGPWSGTLGFFSTQDEEAIDSLSGGEAYYASVTYKASDELRFYADIVKNENDGGTVEDFLGYDWATSFNVVYEKDRFGVLGTVVLGENNGVGARDGNFYGFVAMPWYWILEDKLQAVFQYQYQGSEEDEGVRVNSRYVRAVHDNGIQTTNGRGDSNHSLYAGLNYHFCDHFAKVMGGVEYNTIDTLAGDLDAFTYLIAFRASF